MRAGDGDAEAQPHQLGQHLGARDHRDARARAASSSGLSGRTADENTTTSASPTFAGGVPDVTVDAQRREPIGQLADRFASDPHTL